jgi:hypothetical protein
MGIGQGSVDQSDHDGEHHRRDQALGCQAMKPLPAFIILYAMMYAAGGVASPFWPLFFQSRGAAAEQIGLVIGLGIVARLIAGPAVGRAADMLAALRAVLAACAAHTFAVIRWNAAGIGSQTTGLLWSEAVAAEILVFFFIGPALVNRLGPNGAAALAAMAGIIRWVVMTQSTALAALALVQPLPAAMFASGPLTLQYSPSARTCPVYRPRATSGCEQPQQTAALFDHLVGAAEQRNWQREAQCLRGHVLVGRRSSRLQPVLVDRRQLAA